MYPPPTIIIFLGTASKERAPVDEIIIFSSKSIPGIEIGSEPVHKAELARVVLRGRAGLSLIGQSEGERIALLQRKPGLEQRTTR